VKKSNAALAFTKYNLMAAIEMHAFQGNFLFTDTGSIYQEMFDAFEAKRDTIPHSYHWGKYHLVSSKWVAAPYCSALVEFQEQQSILLDKAGHNMFASDLLKKLDVHLA
jgi:hypothetical protein